MAIIHDRYQLRNIHPGTHDGIRTHTGRGLNPLPLPVGLHAHMVGRVGVEPTTSLESGFTVRRICRFATYPYKACTRDIFNACILSLCYQTSV